ncbi:ubiquitin [Trichoderma arundinaceum]|uniref:Ubiquitin-like modifier HUB1 n=1 Tax=Trichoderma arundinaceum TaxID=490622 RepID=A0A395P0S5_TRIAR|nr:ubiquitin [Trichoderma arundinaceum]
MEGSSSRRSRSRSPPRRAPKGSRGGFRWKEKSRPSDDNYGSYDSRRDRDRDRDRGRDRDYGGRRRDYRDRSRDRGRDRYEGRQRSRSPRRHESSPKDKGAEVKRDVGDKKDKKEKKAPKAAVAAGQEFIIVHVNDRLGTKSAIPCLPSDTVGQFKLMIAARIGREAGQIMLRRQGERPFKDHITLEDYGISNGVQLDLEVDTGD